MYRFAKKMRLDTHHAAPTETPVFAAPIELWAPTIQAKYRALQAHLAPSP